MRLERSLLPLLALIPLAGCVTTRPQSARPLITVEAPTLADCFAELGYATVACVSAAPICSEFSAGAP